MTKATIRMGNCRLTRFAAEAKKAKKFVNCSLMTHTHMAELECPKGFVIIDVNGKPYIGRV